MTVTAERISEQWPAAAIGTVHDLDAGLCRCGLIHQDRVSYHKAGQHSRVTLGLNVSDDVGHHVLWAVGRLEKEADEWGRTGHDKHVAVIDGYSNMRTVRFHPRPAPDRPEDAVDSIDWTDPEFVVVTRWRIPLHFWNDETGYSPFAKWKKEVDKVKVQPAGSGKWAAVYWQNQRLYADRFRTEKRAEAWLKDESDMNLLASVGVAKLGEVR